MPRRRRRRPRWFCENIFLAVPLSPVDALEAYVKEISFLPNPKLAAGGRLTAQASDAAHRGEALFNKPFRHDAAMSCGSCHQPTGVFVDHQVHDVGTGGWFKTPTLVNANFNAPYFHDGRFDSYGQVVGYFDGHFDHGLSDGERADLVAYLDAVGDAKEPTTRNTVQAELDEIAAFVSILDTAIPARNGEVIALTVDAVGNEWRELGESCALRYQCARRPRGTVARARRGARFGADLAAGRHGGGWRRFRRRAQAFADYRQHVALARRDLNLAASWSQFDPEIREAHFAALRQLADLAR